MVTTTMSLRDRALHALAAKREERAQAEQARRELAEELATKLFCRGMEVLFGIPITNRGVEVSWPYHDVVQIVAYIEGVKFRCGFTDEDLRALTWEDASNYARTFAVTMMSDAGHLHEDRITSLEALGGFFEVMANCPHCRPEGAGS